MLESLDNAIAAADSFLWGPPLLIMLLGTHLFYTIRLRFIQRHLFSGFKVVVERDSELSGNVSPFAALSVALASTIGTGNIVGVATAISMGGPGAVFWCMITGFLGMATKYSESLLAVKYRVNDEQGEVHGGPMYTIANGLHCKWLAVFFAVAAAIAVLGTGNLVQSNAIASIVHKTFSAPQWLVGIVLAILCGLVIIGGLQTISKVCILLVPFMAFVYLAGSFTLLFINRAVLGDTFVLIIKSAFSAKAAAGGVAGYGIMLASRYGIARGLFSNEAGMGSEPIVAATAKTRNAVRQGLVSYTGTFCTIVICLLTGLVVVSSVMSTHGGANAIDIKDPLLSQCCFELIPCVGKFILAFAIFAFAITTILGWYYYGEQCIRFLIKNVRIVLFYKVLYIVIIFLGSIGSLSIVWNFSDFANGIMVLPNILSLLLLSHVVVRETRLYLWSNNLNGEDPDCHN